MNFVNRTTSDTKIVVRVNNRVAVRFGHRAIEGGGYACVETTVVSKPKYERVCEIVSVYNEEHRTAYAITREEYNANAADVTPINAE